MSIKEVHGETGGKGEKDSNFNKKVEKIAGIQSHTFEKLHVI